MAIPYLALDSMRVPLVVVLLASASVFASAQEPTLTPQQIEEKFFAENRLKEGVIETESGLQVQTVWVLSNRAGCECSRGKVA